MREIGEWKDRMEEEKPAWYWREKYEDAKDSLGTWRFITVMSWFFLLLFAIKAYTV